MFSVLIRNQEPSDKLVVEERRLLHALGHALARHQGAGGQGAPTNAEGSEALDLEHHTCAENNQNTDTLQRHSDRPVEEALDAMLLMPRLTRQRSKTAISSAEVSFLLRRMEANLLAQIVEVTIIAAARCHKKGAAIRNGSMCLAR